MKVEYIDHMGTDLTVVNAARVSFNKESEWDRQHFDPVTLEEDVFLREMKESDKRLLSYLARHNHWTPFSHPQITLRCSAPIPIRTQLYKHKVGFTENEISRRYVEDDVTFFMPEVLRGTPVDKKQGSTGEAPPHLKDRIQEVYDFAVNHYLSMIEDGLCPEQARFVLPQGMMTQWYWTGSLAAYARVAKLRLSKDAQGEVRDFAQMVSDIIEPLFPYSWSVLVDQ